MIFVQSTQVQIVIKFPGVINVEIKLQHHSLETSGQNSEASSFSLPFLPILSANPLGSTNKIQSRIWPFLTKTTAFNHSTLSHQILVGLPWQLLNDRENLEQKVKMVGEDGWNISVFLYILEWAASKCLSQYLTFKYSETHSNLFIQRGKCSQILQGMRSGSWKVRNRDLLSSSLQLLPCCVCVCFLFPCSN